MTLIGVSALTQTEAVVDLDWKFTNCTSRIADPPVTRVTWIFWLEAPDNPFAKSWEYATFTDPVEASLQPFAIAPETTVDEL